MQPEQENDLLMFGSRVALDLFAENYRAARRPAALDGYPESRTRAWRPHEPSFDRAG